jgi:hypothetical protein
MRPLTHHVDGILVCLLQKANNPLETMHAIREIHQKYNKE